MVKICLYVKIFCSNFFKKIGVKRMKKKTLLASTLVLALMVGCSSNSDENESNQTGDNENIVTAEESRIEEENKSLSNSMKLNFIKNFEGTGIWPLSENRFLIKNGHQSAIYNEDFELVKEVGDIEILTIHNSIGSHQLTNAFEYKIPYFVDGHMESKKGLMDFDGNILYEPQFIDDDNRERIREEMNDVVSSLELDSNYTYSREDVIAGREVDGKYGLVRIQSYPEGVKVLETLVEPIYDELEYGTSGGCHESSTLCEYKKLRDYQDKESIAFKSDGKWGIIDFNGNILLDAEYGEISKVYLYPSSDADQYKVEDTDYYKVIDESGKLGVYSTEVGWIAEPQFDYRSKVEFIASYIVVSDNIRTIFYDNKGNNVYECDKSISFEGLNDETINKRYSSNYFQFENSQTGEKGIMNRAFEIIPLPTERKYDRFYSLGDKAFLCLTDDFSQSRHVIGLDGQFIGEVGSDGDVYFVNNKYIFSNMSVYELSE